MSDESKASRLTPEQEEYFRMLNDLRTYLVDREAFRQNRDEWEERCIRAEKERDLHRRRWEELKDRANNPGNEEGLEIGPALQRWIKQIEEE